MNNTIVIFDFDGVIALNTEEANMEVIVDLINQQLLKENKTNKNANIQWCFKNLVGSGGNEIISKIEKEFKIIINENRIIEKRTIKFEEKNSIKKDNNLVSFLEELKNKEISYCLATSSSELPLYRAIKILKLDKYFSKEKNNIFMVDTLREKNKNATKKDLYEFLKETKFNNYTNLFCIEDSENGVKNAEIADIKNIIVFENEINNQIEKDYYTNTIFDEKIRIKTFDNKLIKIINENARFVN